MSPTKQAKLIRKTKPYDSKLVIKPDRGQEQAAQERLGVKGLGYSLPST